MNKDRIQGAVEQAKGKVKEVATYGMNVPKSDQTE
jgi:hypothetical protein